MPPRSLSSHLEQSFEGQGGHYHLLTGGNPRRHASPKSSGPPGRDTVDPLRDDFRFPGPTFSFSLANVSHTNSHLRSFSHLWLEASSHPLCPPPHRPLLGGLMAGVWPSLTLSSSFAFSAVFSHLMTPGVKRPPLDYHHVCGIQVSI